jgi:electron transfer flavoprotein alpha subunit
MKGKEMFVLVEHRQGVLRDITFEMLSASREVAEKMGVAVSAVLLGHNVGEFGDRLKNYAEKVLQIEDAKLENFNSEAYQKVLTHLIKEREPVLTLIGNTPFGMDLAPSMATEIGLPLATDCIGMEVDEGKLVAIRQFYGGKVNARVLLKGDRYVVTIRPAAFEAKELSIGGEIEKIESPLTEEIEYRQFVGYEEAPAGEVDISAADTIVSVGRGVGDYSKDEVREMIEGFAAEIGAVVGCSRPIVDKGWLPKDRQVGTSGKTVKPKLYIALGISGSFQHLAGMSASDTIVAVNKDPKAPIFTIADYGIVDDLAKVTPVLTEKIKGIKGG